MKSNLGWGSVYSSPGRKQIGLFMMAIYAISCWGCDGSSTTESSAQNEAAGEQSSTGGDVTGQDGNQATVEDERYIPDEATLALCPFAGDDLCDEPANCAFGTDAHDCDKACAQQPPDASVYGACQFRQQGLPDHDKVSDDELARGSAGSGGIGGFTYRTIDAIGPDGQSDIRRYYSVYIPDSYDPNRPSPMIFYGGGMGDQMYHNRTYTDLEALAERHRVIIAYVQQDYRDFGFVDNAYWMAWYVYLNAFIEGWSNCPDIDFFVAVVQELASQYNVDRTRVFLSGTSRGGGISIMGAFLRPDVFAGFASHAGFVHVNQFEDYIPLATQRKVGAVLVAGSADTNVDPSESQTAADLLTSLGWAEENKMRHYYVVGGGHQWQTHLLQEWFDFLYDNPIPLEEVWQ